MPEGCVKVTTALIYIHIMLKSRRLISASTKFHLRKCKLDFAFPLVDYTNVRSSEMQLAQKILTNSVLR